MAFTYSAVDAPDTSALMSQLQERAGSLSRAAWARFADGQQQNQMEAMQAGSQAPQQGIASSVSGYGNVPSARASDNASDNVSGYGFADNVPRSLIGTESGGNWSAQNNEMGSGGKSGHYGILQFGQARLEDGKRAGVIPANMTPEQFVQSRDAQVAMSNWHFADIDRRIAQQGYDRMVGQNVGGVTLSMDGMRSMAHLGGFGGLSNFISSGGRSNPSDSFGTSLAAYGTKHQSGY